jgi:N,N'-diacetyllegionaminate synthase
MGFNNISIDNKKVGEGNPVFIIAEVGINHNGNLETAKLLIKAAKDCGASAVKLQTYITEKRVPKESPIFELLKSCELNLEQTSELFKYARELGIIIFSTPFDDESVDFLESINSPVYKVASFDTVNKSLLRRIGKTNKPIIMSTGMTNFDELNAARKALETKIDGSDCALALLHCVSSYPTPVTESNLSLISLLHKLHQGPVGYSDHTIGIEIAIMSVAAGAQIIEKHFTLNTRDKGPDHALSADPKVLRNLSEGVRRVEQILGKKEMRLRDVEKEIEQYRRKSV